MDTKLKNSHKKGIIVVTILLVFCSVMMMAGYSDMSSSVESAESSTFRYDQAFSGIGSDLAEGNYLLYNEYSQETSRTDILRQYGQRSFDLTKRFLDYEIIDDEGNALLENSDETVFAQLIKDETDYYGLRVKYVFESEGNLADIQIDGTAIKPEKGYELESGYLTYVSETENNSISDITTPENVTIVYGMTEENLNAYADMCIPSSSSMYDLGSTNAYRDTLEVLSLLVIAAALILPFRKKLDISELKLFAAPFEIPAALILFGPGLLYYVPVSIAYLTVTDRLLPGMGHGMELVAGMFNFLMWMVIFGVIFWAITSLRAMFRMKGAYWKERTLTAAFIRRMRKKNAEDQRNAKEKAAGCLRKGKEFFARQYDTLLHLDFRDKTNRMILRVVCINFVILFFVCLLWLYGTVALIIYSILLFLFLRKYTKDIQEKYKLLLKSTNELAEGHLDVPIEGDIGLFNPIQEELKKIQKGFKKAVDEEVKNERMKTELVTNVSHDLRTPLTAIITYTDLLKQEQDEERRKEYIAVLERKSHRLKILIEDLFEISKAASKNVSMHYVKVDIVDLLKQVVLENDEKIKDANLDFRWKLPEQKVIMWLDSQKTYRIFENLIVNITKYAMPHTRVYIQLEEQEKTVHISMKNVSAGELDFNVEEITDRFVRGDSSRNTEGSGLGLAIAKSFVELQHGSLKISTEADLFKADIILLRTEMSPEEKQKE